MGAHVWLPAYVKSSLLPHLRITGWTPDWYDGFPALTYYFPGPIVAIALLSYVIPYNIAFKLVTVLGLLTLPVAAWAFGRLARLRFPGPACLALATLPVPLRPGVHHLRRQHRLDHGRGVLLLDRPVAGPGVPGAGRPGPGDGRHRALAAVLLAAVRDLPHPAAVLRHRRRHRADPDALRPPAPPVDRCPVLVVGGALIAFWALPFYVRLPYATNMGYQKLTDYVGSLFPGTDTWLFVLAGAGVLLSLACGATGWEPSSAS